MSSVADRESVHARCLRSTSRALLAAAFILGFTIGSAAAFCVRNESNVQVNLEVSLQVPDDSPPYKAAFFPGERRCCKIGSMLCVIKAPPEIIYQFHVWLEHFGRGAGCAIIAPGTAQLTLRDVYIESPSSRMLCEWQE